MQIALFKQYIKIKISLYSKILQNNNLSKEWAMKWFAIMLISINISYGYTWSSLGMSGFNREYANLNNLTKEQMEELKKIWNSEIKPIIENVKEETNKKKILLEQLKELAKKQSFNQRQIKFLLSQESQILGNQSNIKSTKE